MTEDIDTLWTYEVEDNIDFIAISRNGDFLFAGSSDGRLYCIERAGYVLWKGKIEGEIRTLHLVEALQCVLIGSRDGKVYRWNYQGHLLEILDNGGDISELSSTPTTHRIAIGTQEGVLSLYSSDGQLLWQRWLPGSIHHLSLASDGNTLIFTCSDHHIYCFDGMGNQRWLVAANNGDWTGTALSTSASCLLASSTDRHVSCFDRSGHLYWSSDIRADIHCITLTPDGHLAAAGSSEQQIWLWRQNGELVWKSSTPGKVYTLALSYDGRFIAAGTERQTVVLLDEQGHLLWKQQTHARTKAIAMTANGRLIATVGTDHKISLIENLRADEDIEQWEARRLIREVRRLTTQNRAMGIALWFDSFDQALQERHLDVCEQLVQELRSGGHELEDEEWRWVESREGTLWLYQGLHYQQRQENELAQRAYKRSQERQQALHYLRGEGQTIAALSTLEGKRDSYDTIFFSLQTDPPQLLGNGEMLLQQRIKNDVEERQQVLIAAQQRGYLAPLLTALSSSEPSLQATAAAGLSMLRPGPEIKILLEMLVSERWLIRWQAALMLERYIQGASGLTEQRERVHRVVLERLSQENDPIVREALILVLGDSKDFASQSLLLALLSDEDPNVRIASARMLGKRGTLRAVSALQHIVDGRDFNGHSISETAGKILEQIVQRYPPPQIKQIALYSVSSLQNEQMQSTALFLSSEAVIQCVTVCTGALPGTKIYCSFKGPNKRRWQQEQSLDEANMVRDEIDFSDHQSPLLQQEISIGELWTKATFSFPSSAGSWPVGNYEVQASFENGIQRKSHFKIIDTVKIKHIITSPGVNTAGELLNETKIFARGMQIYCSILIEEAPRGIEVQGSVHKVAKGIGTQSSLLNNFLLHNLHLNTQSKPASNLSLKDQRKSKTLKEGEQNIILTWDTTDWEPGIYVVRAYATPGNEVRTSFQIVL
jgi:outer membrane protein assembly factor BamB